MDGTYSTVGRTGNANRILVEKRWGKLSYRYDLRVGGKIILKRCWWKIECGPVSDFLVQLE
jgi:hypothetical protein